jgi:16S rRNA (cytidine1402-2'-O)-methyltransferase
MPADSPGTLYVVATPLGNLEDITVRAARILGEVDKVLAEDTRRTRKLLTHLGHGTAMLSVHEHNERGRVEQVCRMLEQGQDLALVSDAGTPAISDPGFPLIRGVLAANFQVVPIPGACALTTAVCAAGLPTDRIHFVGFLPGRPGRRKTLLEEAVGLKATLVLYISPHKLVRDLKMLVEVAGAERPACLCRELTKVHEEFDRGSLGELLERWSDKKVRGEITMVVGPLPKGR